MNMDQAQKLRYGDKVILKAPNYKYTQSCTIAYFLELLTTGKPEIGGTILVRVSIVDARLPGFNRDVHSRVVNALLCAPYSQQLWDWIRRRMELTWLIEKCFSASPRPAPAKPVADLKLAFDIQPRYDLFLKKPREEAESATDKADNREAAEQYRLAKAGNAPGPQPSGDEIPF